MNKWVNEWKLHSVIYIFREEKLTSICRFGNIRWRFKWTDKNPCPQPKNSYSIVCLCVWMCLNNTIRWPFLTRPHLINNNNSLHFLNESVCLYLLRRQYSFEAAFFLSVNTSVCISFHFGLKCKSRLDLVFFRPHNVHFSILIKFTINTYLSAFVLGKFQKP